MSSPDKAVLLAQGLLVLSIAASGIFWINNLQQRNTAAADSARLGNRTGADRAGYVAGELAASRIFGDPGLQATPVASRVPLSSLNLKLTGVVSSDSGGFAMISVNGQPQTPFFAGEKVYQDTILESVLPDRVILLRGGTRESLLLDPELNQ